MCQRILAEAMQRITIFSLISEMLQWKEKGWKKVSKEISNEPEPSEVESMTLVAERKLKNALRRVIVIFL
ncbi:MAG: hypothetical protein QXP46_01465 [Archaeoglobaceae archaeon]